MFRFLWFKRENKKIADFCKEKHIYLLEDCSHAHGAEIYGKKSWYFWRYRGLESARTENCYWR
ncbi:hypothetical protein EUA76_01650 [TM7 phylum sp. oral taxon 350]|nr:hypothetical protein EUA76_01650 [TM7 phylum sp. oral taxon 350]